MDIPNGTILGPQEGRDELQEHAGVGDWGPLKQLTKVKETVPQGHYKRLDTPLRAKGTVADFKGNIFRICLLFGVTAVVISHMSPQRRRLHA